MNVPTSSNLSPKVVLGQTAQNKTERKDTTETSSTTPRTNSNSSNAKNVPHIPVSNNAIQELSKQNQSTNVVAKSNVAEVPSSSTTSKGKNAQKRERNKNLHIDIPGPSHNITQLNEIIRPASAITVQEYFIKHVAPLYAFVSTRYLENLSHHPQFHLMHTQQFNYMFQNQLAISLPNTPMVQYRMQTHQLQSYSLHNSPEVKFMQNAMQHPLLRQSFQIQQRPVRPPFPLLQSPLRLNYQYPPQNINMNSHYNIAQQQNSAKNKSDLTFDPYMSAVDVEKGLKNNVLLEGVIRINPKQFQHAYVSSIDRSEQDVLIDGVKNRNKALEGDVVIVEFIINENKEDSKENKEDKQKIGRVVFIKERVHPRTCIGNLKLMSDKNKQKASFVPRDYRIPRLNIPFIYWPDNFYEKSAEYENTLFLAQIMDWYDTRFALGKIVCNVGLAGEIQTETKAILMQTDLDVTPYGHEFKHLYPGLDYVVPDEEIKLREDCRKLCIFSIDPYNCRDIDDAVSSRRLENGNYEIGVHISDVTHYLAEGTPLDDKVSEKATTVYMVERAYHMLPDELCMLCSLLPGVDKLAFSVFWEITEDGKVLNHRFAKTVINSCCQLAYEHAQSVLDDTETNFPEFYNGFQYKDVYDTIKILGKISAIFRKRRFDEGALRIDQTKITFKLSPVNGLPESYSVYESRTSHQLIEEFMLLANMTVAERIYYDHPQIAFLRCHPPPSAYMLNQIINSLKPIGIELDASSAGDLHRTLSPHAGPDCPDKGKAQVLSMLCAKPMARAKYFCPGRTSEDFSHYALNVPLYTHFTSPIRRYADIMVHRLLAASLNYREVPKWDSEKVHIVANNCNKQKYNAKKAGELCIELYTLKYIELNSPLITEAVVFEVRDKYLDVIIVNMGLNRRIFFNNDFPGKFNCVKNDAGMKLSRMEIEWDATENSPSVKQVIEVFSMLQVEMNKGDEMVKVEIKLIRPQ